MKLTLHRMAVDSFAPMMESFVAILDKAIAFEAAGGPDLVNARLAPDMYGLAQQVQIFCQMAAGGVDRLTGRAPAEREEPETTLEGLKAQVERTVARIRAVPAEAFAGAEDRDCTFEIMDGMVLELDGEELLRAWLLPHFYFHLVTAYDILRSRGLEIGKIDYMSRLGLRIRQQDAAGG